METTDRLCCDCIHFRASNLLEPCAKGYPKCGYLHEGCWAWTDKAQAVAMPTKVCTQCGRTLTIDKFYRIKRVLNDICKECSSYKDMEAQRMKKQQQKEWTERDDALLTELYPQKSVSIRSICEKLGRTEDAVYKRANEMRLKRKKRVRLPN